MKRRITSFPISWNDLSHILNDTLYAQTIGILRGNFNPEHQVKLTINGKEREVRSSKTVTELVQELKINAPNIAVALNCQVIPKSLYPETLVKEGDQIEIVHAVGGGV